MKKKRLLQSVTVFILFSTLPATAVSAGTLQIDIDDAINRALNHNIELRVEQLSLSGRKAERESDWNRFMPGVSAGVSISRPLIDPPEPDPWSATAGLRGSLSLSVEAIRRGQRTVLQYRSGELSYQAARAALVRDVRIGFYGLLVQEENLRLKKESLDAARERYEQSLREFELGRISQYTALADRVAYENQRSELNRMQDDFLLAKARFALLTGLPGNQEFKPVGNLDPILPGPSMNGGTETWIRNRPDIQLAENRVLQQELETDLLRLGFLPSLSAGYTYQLRNTEPFESPWFDDPDTRWVPSAQVEFGLTLPLDPLFPASARRGRIRESERQTEQALLQREAAFRAAVIEIEDAIRRVNRAEQALKLVELSLQLAREALALAETSYDRGVIDALELRAARLEYERAEISALEERYRAVVAIVDLEHAMAVSEL